MEPRRHHSARARRTLELRVSRLGAPHRRRDRARPPHAVAEVRSLLPPLAFFLLRRLTYGALAQCDLPSVTRDAMSSYTEGSMSTITKHRSDSAFLQAVVSNAVK